MPSQCEQYGSTAHLFIGTRRSPCKITPMPFSFANNSIVIHRGLNSLFPFKSVSFSLSSCRSSLAHSFRSVLSFVSLVLLHTVILTQVRMVQVRRYLLMSYTPETLLNHVFEDLRKPKALNTNRGLFSPSSSLFIFCYLISFLLQFSSSNFEIQVFNIKTQANHHHEMQSIIFTNLFIYSLSYVSKCFKMKFPHPKLGILIKNQFLV
jgi:hypothetical protein